MNRQKYRNMSDAELVITAEKISSSAAKLQEKNDPLYAVIRERGLNGELQQRWGRVPRGLCSSLSDPELYDAVCKEQVGGMVELKKRKNYLYEAVKARPRLYRQIAQDFGWRQLYETWSWEDWVEVGSKYDSYQGFYHTEHAAYSGAQRIGIMEKLQQYMLQEKIWEPAHTESGELKASPSNRMSERHTDEELIALATAEDVDTIRDLEKSYPLLKNVLTKRGLQHEWLYSIGKITKEWCDGQTDNRLFELVCSLGGLGLDEIHAYSAPLYFAVRGRVGLREKLREKYGWRRPETDIKSLSYDEIKSICGRFKSPQDLQDYQPMMLYLRRHPELWKKINYELMTEQTWTGTITAGDGRIYDSKSELMMANLLARSDIAYIPHAVIAPEISGHRCDFFLPEHNIYIEIYAGSEDPKYDRTNEPVWMQGYMENREWKEDLYSQLGKTRIAIEHDVWRFHGSKEFVLHMRTMLSDFGIQTLDVDHKQLNVSAGQRGLKWAIEEFVEFAVAEKFHRFSDFLSTGYSDLYKIMEARNIRDEVRLALDLKLGRRSRSSESIRPSVEELKQWCECHNIVGKDQYVAAYFEGRLPLGAPNDIRQVYDIGWNQFFYRRGRNDFLTYKEAKDIVHDKGYKSSSEFRAACQTDPDLIGIRRNPENRHSGGYPEWESWDEFLGR